MRLSGNRHVGSNPTVSVLWSTMSNLNPHRVRFDIFPLFKATFRIRECRMKKQNSQKQKTKQLKTVTSEPPCPNSVTSRIPSPETLNRAGANSLRLFKKGSAFVNTKIFVKKQSFCFDCVKKTTMIFSWTVRNKDEAL